MIYRNGAKGEVQQFCTGETLYFKTLHGYCVYLGEKSD